MSGLAKKDIEDLLVDCATQHASVAHAQRLQLASLQNVAYVVIVDNLGNVFKVFVEQILTGGPRAESTG